jgi:hypothetical protein
MGMPLLTGLCQHTGQLAGMLASMVAKRTRPGKRFRHPHSSTLDNVEDEQGHRQFSVSEGSGTPTLWQRGDCRCPLPSLFIQCSTRLRQLFRRRLGAQFRGAVADLDSPVVRVPWQPHAGSWA